MKPPTKSSEAWSHVSRSRSKLTLKLTIAYDGTNYAGRLPHDVVARTLARAAGHWGSGAQYLFNTVENLAAHGIRDRNLWALQSLVANEIRSLPVDA